MVVSGRNAVAGDGRSAAPGTKDSVARWVNERKGTFKMVVAEVDEESPRAPKFRCSDLLIYPHKVKFFGIL